MIEVSVARTTRKVADELGEEAGIRPFFSRALIRLDRQEAIELCERASKLYPNDSEGRGLYIRRSVRSAVRGR